MMVLMPLLARLLVYLFFFFQAEDGIRDLTVTGVQTCALPISLSCRTYVFAQDRLAPVRSSASIALACKNPVLRPDVGTTFSPLRQSVRESRMHWHWLLR